MAVVRIAARSPDLGPKKAGRSTPSYRAAQQQLVARDYGMTGIAAKAVWAVELRRCLIPYFASVYGLDRTDRSPLRQRIVLQNLETMRPWLFGTAEESA